MLGWGTDIGGSIRIPSHMNGLWGLKPTVCKGIFEEQQTTNITFGYQSSRLPYRGVPVSTEGQEHVPSSIGPMARTLSSLTHAMQLVLQAQTWLRDPKVAPIPWREEIFQEAQTRPLTIGILVDDGVVKVHPPIERVLKELESKLKAAGHDIVQWDASGHKECIEIMVSHLNSRTRSG